MTAKPKAISSEGVDPAIVQVALDGRTHEVTIKMADRARMAPDYPADKIAEAAFRFLLDREPASAIMVRFDLMVIKQYFPDFEDRLDDYL